MTVSLIAAIVFGVLAYRRAERLERLQYASHIAATLHEWEAGRAEAAWDHFNACRADYRDWEYDYVYTQPESNRLASAGQDHTVRVWDTDSRQQLLLIQVSEGSVWCHAVAYAFAARRGGLLRWNLFFGVLAGVTVLQGLNSLETWFSFDRVDFERIESWIAIVQNTGSATKDTTPVQCSQSRRGPPFTSIIETITIQKHTNNLPPLEDYRESYSAPDPTRVPGIRIVLRPSGKEFRFHSQRFRAMARGTLLIALLAAAVLWKPFPLALFFGGRTAALAVMVGMFLLTLVLWTRYTRVLAERGQLTVIRGCAVWRRSQTVEAANVETLTVVPSHGNYVMWADVRDGRRICVAEIDTEFYIAEWLREEVKRCLGIIP